MIIIIKIINQNNKVRLISLLRKMAILTQTLLGFLPFSIMAKAFI
jgi:hypothetical protein